MIRTKRVYDEAAPEDGLRVLIDRLWPRGLAKAKARVDAWRPELAPSSELRTWYGHDPARFAEFRRRYRRELERPVAAIAALAVEAATRPVTLLYAARDGAHSNAAVLQELIAEHLARAVPRSRPRVRRSTDPPGRSHRGPS